MKVEFKKTGERRYAVKVLRDDLPELEMNPAPGFDPLMPHDLLHFLVEREFGLQNGIFGQIAKAGTAGTFHQTNAENSNKRAASRIRRKTEKRGKKLLKENLDDCAKSERATYVCLYDWLSHSADKKLKSRTEEMKLNVESIFGQMSETERISFTNKKLSEIRTQMDELSERWSPLKVNESITLDWLF